MTLPDTAPHPLATLLDAEADALAIADFDRVAALAEEKLALLQSVQEAGLQEKDISYLQELSARNALMFDATMEGLRSVIDRLKHVQRATVHLDTYTAGGTLQDLGPARTRFEKRS